MKYYADVSDEEIKVIYNRIVENIKRIRISKDITQEKIALSMGFTTATFYTNAESLKRGKHFNLEHLIKIAYILNVDIKELFDEVVNDTQNDTQK